MAINSITLRGRESRILASDVSYGSSGSPSSLVIYSTAEIMFAGTFIDGRDALILSGVPEAEYEVMLRRTSSSHAGGNERTLLREGIQIHDSEIDEQGSDHTLFTISKGVQGIITLIDTPEKIVLYIDEDTTTNLWLPPVEFPSSPSPFSSFYQFGTNFTLLISGPHLIRRLTLYEDSTMSIEGDLKDGVRLELVGLPKNLRKLTWNGSPIDTGLSSISTSVPSISSTFLPSRLSSTAKGRFDPPELKNWKFSDSLPEIGDEFDDSTWIEANHTETNCPYKPYDYGENGKPVLYGCDYGL